MRSVVSRRVVGVLGTASIIIGLVVGTGMLPADGATGDVVATIYADRSGTACADSGPPNYSIPDYWTGIAFDGTNLVLSCHADQNLVFVNPTNGAQTRILAVTGAGDLGAMAFDGKTNTLWVCSGEDVGTVNVTTGAYTLAFTTDTGCLDGLAFDGSDDTLWASGDAETTLVHYSTAGDTLNTFPVQLGNFGNSGIAVGGQFLYLGNNGGAEIYESTKDVTAPTLFIDSVKTGGRHVEDLECDNLTFAAQGQAVIWAQDAYDNIITAYEIPEGNCFFGGGVTPTTEPPVTDPPTGDIDCADITHAEAQAILDQDPSDPNGLDADHDGDPCEGAAAASTTPKFTG